MSENIDNDFGRLVASIRKNKKIKASELVKGLCGVDALKRIENGEKLPGYLMRSILIKRLGLAPEWFESMLYPDEYDEWRLRRQIIHTLERGGCSEAYSKLEEYRKKYMLAEPERLLSGLGLKDAENSLEARIRAQFYIEMNCIYLRKQCSSADRNNYREFAEQYSIAARMTSDIYADEMNEAEPIGRADKDKLAGYKLAVYELNLYVEAAWCEYLAAPEDEKSKEKISRLLEIIMVYMDEHYYDGKTMCKLYPKLVVYYCRVNEAASDEILHYDMWKKCDKAVAMLRKQMRAYYMIELFDIQLALADNVCNSLQADEQENCRRELEEKNRQTTVWRNVLAKEYTERDIPVMMQDDCYMRYESVAYCINDVIRARRRLLGYSRKQLSEGICAEKTIEKTEQHRSNPQYANMKELYRRLNLQATYQTATVISGNFRDLEMYEEMKVYFHKNMYGEAFIRLEQLKKNLPNYVVNRQQLETFEIFVNRQLNKISKIETIEKMFQVLEITIPIDRIDHFINNKEHGLMKNDSVNKRIYLTSPEIGILIRIGNNYDILENYEKADYYLELLYDYFHNDEDDVLYGRISAFSVLSSVYSCMLGNYGQYAKSNKVADEAAFSILTERRLEKLWWFKYNNLWNNKVESTDTEEYNSVLKECIALCQICNVTSAELLFKKKLK